MNLTDFELSALLSFRPEEGRLLLQKDRMLLFRQAAFAFLQKVLAEQLGRRVTHAVLSQFGYRCGFGDFDVLSKAFDWETEQDALGCGPLMHCWEGIVAVEPTLMDFDRARGHFDFKGFWYNSYEAEIHLSNFGRCDHPVCSSLTGYASGWCSAFFGRELLAVEHMCAGKGDPHCSWQVRPIETWGSEADFWREALEATTLSIAHDLERQVGERTREVQKMVAVLEEKNQALTELDRMKSEFLANISHEVRTPLTLMLGPLNSLIKEPDLPITAQKHLGRMSRNCARLYRLVNQLLDYAKLEAGQMGLHLEPVQVDALVACLIDEAQGQAEEKDITLHWTCTKRPPLLMLDREKVEKVVINLVGNALKFCRPGDRIEVSLSFDNSLLSIEVKDSGPGISPADQERIFMRFQQVDASSTRQHEGTGIGLALVKEFCELHQGTIAVESELGKGACFRICLPFTEAETAEATSTTERVHFPEFEKATSHPNRDLSLPTVVIAEDQSDLRSYIAELLHTRYNVYQARDGQEALELIHRHPPKVVVSDVMMPKMDGIGLVNALKGHPETAHIPIILVTARAGTEASVDGLEAGADDYITKPFTDAELLARLGAAIRMRELYDRLEAQNALLNEEVSKRERLEQERNLIQKQLVEASREAGRAEVATSILHNAGNVLNSVSISVSMMLSEEAGEPLPLLNKVVDLINSHKADLGSFFATSKGPAVLEALQEISHSLQRNQAHLEEELNRVEEQVEQLNRIVSQQNAFATADALVESVNINHLVHSAVEFGALNQGAYGIEILEHYQENLPDTLLDRHKTLQILFNLLKNAREALSGTDREDRCIIVRTWMSDEKLMVSISDNGMGIAKETLLRIFNSGFSTKLNGNGFGLHRSANLAREMNGRLRAHSPGLGQGATFTLSLPIAG